MKQWYVVNTKGHEETKALLHLKRQSFNAYLPQYKKIRRHARRTYKILAPLFPNYLFVEFDLDLENWSTINSTIGVSALIKFGSRPTPIPAELVHEIRTHEDPENMRFLNQNLNIKSGDGVSVISGAFNNYSRI